MLLLPIEREPNKTGLEVNGGTTKYMLFTKRNMRRIGSQITTDNYTFDMVKECIYFVSDIKTKHDAGDKA